MGTFKQKQNPFWYRLFFYALILVCIALITTPVLAVDYSGSLTQSSTLNVTTFTVAMVNVGGTGAGPLDSFYAIGIENFQSLTYLLLITDRGNVAWDYTYQGGSKDVTFWIGAVQVGAGVFAFNNNSATGKVHIVVSPTWWNVTGLSGNKVIDMQCTDADWAAHKLYDLELLDLNKEGPMPGAGHIVYPGNVEVTSAYSGDYTIYNMFSFRNDWTMTRTAYVTTISITKTFSGSYPSRIGIYQTDNTLITQESTFNITPFSAYAMVVPIKVAALDTLNHWHNSSYYYQDEYIVAIDPNPASTSAPSSGTISSFTSDLSRISGVYWKVDGLSFYEAGSGSKTLNYVKIGTHWYGWDTATGNWSNDKGTTFPNPVYLNFTSSGNKTILTEIFCPSGAMPIYTTVLVTGVAAGSLTVSAVDWSTGTLISNAEIDMLDQNHIIWYNNTAPTGKWTNPFPIGTHVRVDAKATGYQDRNPYIEGLLIDGDVSWTLKMYPIGYNVTPDIAKTTLYLNVYDGKYPTSAKVPLGGATAFARNTLGNLEIAPVPDSGSVTFILDNQTTYFMSASKTGYVTAGQYINTTTAYQYLDLYPMPVVVTGTPTITPTTVTPTPTISGYVPGTGNFTGFWSPFQNLAVAMGADPGYVGVLMALFLAFAGLVVGSIGPSMFTSTIVFNPVGGEIGALLGVAGSVAFGFFPLYIAIIVVVGLILYVSLRVYGVTR